MVLLGIWQQKNCSSQEENGYFTVCRMLQDLGIYGFISFCKYLVNVGYLLHMFDYLL